MSDFFNTGNSTKNSLFSLNRLFFEIYEFQPHPDVFLGLNLQWPNFELPTSYSKYFLSFHTEYLHLDWVLDQAKKVYPKQIILVADYAINPGLHWPDNIKTVKWITIHKQIKLLQKITGVNTDIAVPQYKISSLSFRVSQYKKFVTAYLLKHFANKDMILTYHNVILTYHNNPGKIDDHHSFPPGFAHLDALDVSSVDKTLINFDDDFAGASPIKNGDWNNNAYNNALINLTNESFHYSGTVFNQQPDIWPGPYITEKTFKPLLAGRPLLVIGQFQTYEYLSRLGFDVNFGFDRSYDNDPGDLTRIGKIFKVLDTINATPIDLLFDSSIDAVKFNLEWIRSNNFYQHCQDLNGENSNFLKNII